MVPIASRRLFGSSHRVAQVSSLPSGCAKTLDQSKAMVVQISILDSSEFDGTTWYSIRVIEDLREWLCKKRYSQFLELDALLASVPLQRLPLPPKGTVGIRKMLNLGNFNEERQRGLASYLAYLAGQIQSLAQVPALSAFLAPAPLGQPVVAQGVVQPVMAQPVPGTAAVTAGAPVTMQAQQAFQPSAPVATPVATPIAVPVAPVVTGVAVASPYAAPANAQPYPQPAYPVQAASAAPASGGASGGGFGAELLGAGAVAGVLAGVAGAAMMHGSSHSSHHEYCYKCEGRGFRHNSSMNHNERPDKRCFFCEDCDACRGRGMHASPRHHHGSHHHHHGHGGGFMDTLGFGGRQECFKCEGKGFFHDSSMNHDAGPNSRCFFCKDCSGCKGRGHIEAATPWSKHGQMCTHCHGHGFVHESSMNHDKARDEKCFFCKDCRKCHGKGHL
eukprot:s1628_g3.t1